MRARALLDGASLGPDALKAVGQAFDEAWAEIASHFAHDATQLEDARLMLASALLSIADDTSRDVAVLKKAALEVMSQNYASLPIGSKTSDRGSADGELLAETSPRRASARRVCSRSIG